MKKKMIALLLGSALLLSGITGCGNKESASAGDTEAGTKQTAAEQGKEETSEAGGKEE